MTDQAIDSDDRKWLGFHARINEQAKQGTQWWGRESFNSPLHRNRRPRMHILNYVTRVGDHGDALYIARCGYKHRFKRVFLEKPKAPVRPPHTLLRCLNCINTLKETTKGK